MRLSAENKYWKMSNGCSTYSGFTLSLWREVEKLTRSSCTYTVADASLRSDMNVKTANERVDDNANDSHVSWRSDDDSRPFTQPLMHLRRRGHSAARAMAKNPREGTQKSVLGKFGPFFFPFTYTFDVVAQDILCRAPQSSRTQ